jgi:hypothetical protein
MVVELALAPKGWLILQDDYSFDLFISYKRDRRIAHWMNRVVEILGYHLEQHYTLCRPRLFFDVNSIEDGSLWPDEIRGALKCSRCMLSFWSADYFYGSEWCISEWQSFVERERLTGLKPGRLILPVIRNDGDSLPESIKLYQARNLSEFTRTVGAFWETQKAVEFEGHLAEIAVRLAERMSSAPPFDPEFPVISAAPLPRPSFTPTMSRGPRNLQGGIDVL